MNHTDEHAGNYIVQEVSILDLLQTLDNSVDQYQFEYDDNDIPCRSPWDAFVMTMDYKLSECFNDESDNIIQDTIAGTIIAPICIRVIDGNWSVGNGNHRLASAIAAAADTILVVFSETYSFMLEVITTQSGWD